MQGLHGLSFTVNIMWWILSSCSSQHLIIEMGPKGEAFILLLLLTVDLLYVMDRRRSSSTSAEGWTVMLDEIIAVCIRCTWEKMIQLAEMWPEICHLLKWDKSLTQTQTHTQRGISFNETWIYKVKGRARHCIKWSPYVETSIVPLTNQTREFYSNSGVDWYESFPVRFMAHVTGSSPNILACFI